MQTVVPLTLETSLYHDLPLRCRAEQRMDSASRVKLSGQCFISPAQAMAVPKETWRATEVEYMVNILLIMVNIWLI